MNHYAISTLSTISSAKSSVKTDIYKGIVISFTFKSTMGKFPTIGILKDVLPPFWLSVFWDAGCCLLASRVFKSVF